MIYPTGARCRVLNHSLTRPDKVRLWFLDSKIPVCLLSSLIGEFRIRSKSVWTWPSREAAQQSRTQSLKRGRNWWSWKFWVRMSPAWQHWIKRQTIKNKINWKELWELEARKLASGGIIHHSHQDMWGCKKVQLMQSCHGPKVVMKQKNHPFLRGCGLVSSATVVAGLVTLDRALMSLEGS